MIVRSWFIFDIGNVMIRLDYEGVLAGVSRDTAASTDEIIEALGRVLPDFERGWIEFSDVHEHMRKRIGYLGSEEKLRKLWLSLLAAPVDGIEELMDRVREHYKVAYISNCNAPHAEVIAKKFRILFRKEEPIIYSHECEAVKPDPGIFRKALERLDTGADDVVYVDDLLENVRAAISVGIEAYQFESVAQITRVLEDKSVLPREAEAAAP